MEATKLFRRYEEGTLTRHELLVCLCQSAADTAPAAIAAELPADVLAEIREWSMAPPNSLDHCRMFGSGFVGPRFGAEAYFHEKSRRLFDGLWQWHRYFADADLSR